MLRHARCRAWIPRKGRRRRRKPLVSGLLRLQRPSQSVKIASLRACQIPSLGDARNARRRCCSAPSGPPLGRSGRSGTAKPLLPPANYIDALGGSRLFPGSSQEASRTARRALQNEEPPIHERCITFVLPDPPGHANQCAADSAPAIKLRPRPMALAKRLVTFPLAVGRLPVASGCC